MAEAQFMPGPLAARGITPVDSFASGVEEGQSMMARASSLRQQRKMEEMNKIKAAQEVMMMPLRQAEMQAKTAKAKTDYMSAMNMQESLKGVYGMVDKARNDFNFVNQIEDSKARAKASLEWLSRYSQIENFAEFEKEFGSFAKLAAKNVEAFATIGGAEEQFFNRLTAGMPKDDKTKAARVKLGLEARPSGAAIQYKIVTGPDGAPSLVAVDPREVGAQVVGTGQTFGSGVSDTPESQRFADSGQPDNNVFRGQTTSQEATDKATATKEAERKASLTASRPKRTQAIKQAGALTEQLSTDIDELIGKVTSATAGPGGVVLDKFPGTTARDFQANLDSIKANIGFQTLQAMREASPTGGALGQVSDAENRLLQSRFGSLEIGQSPSQLISNLKKIRQRIVESYGVTRAAYDSEYGEGAHAETAPSADAPITVGKYKVRVN